MSSEKLKIVHKACSKQAFHVHYVNQWIKMTDKGPAHQVMDNSVQDGHYSAKIGRIEIDDPTRL